MGWGNKADAAVASGPRPAVDFEQTPGWDNLAHQEKVKIRAQYNAIRQAIRDEREAAQ